jgi:Uri superfamily endonuclease
MRADVAALVRSVPDLEQPGCYLLRLRLASGRRIRVGKLGTFPFAPGQYLYVGSALGGLARRLARYLRKSRALRWHIDYLLQFAEIDQIWYSIRNTSAECLVSSLLAEEVEVGPKRFGSSDCQCRSHLFRLRGQPERLKTILEGAGGVWAEVESRLRLCS